MAIPPAFQETFDELMRMIPAHNTQEQMALAQVAATLVAGGGGGGGNGGGGGGVSYSLEEQETGLTWLDGQMIYQRTFGPFTPSAGGWFTYSEPNFRVVTVVKVWAIQRVGNAFYDFPWSEAIFNGQQTFSNSVFVAAEGDGSLTVRVDSSQTWPVTITVQYTKGPVF